VVYQNCDERFEGQATAEQKQTVRQKHQLPDKFILCVGTVEKRKNQLTVLKAFHELNEQGLSLVFIGRETDYAAELKTYIQANNLGEKVIFLKNISQEDLPVIYQLAGIFIYASEFEGFGIPVLEGLRSGIPVIAANASSLPEVGGEAVVYFDPHSVEELTMRLKEVNADVLSAALKDKITEQVKKLTPGC
jgi:glycosyltransferase involved in cell wall biosynthesis